MVVTTGTQAAGLGSSHTADDSAFYNFYKFQQHIYISIHCSIHCSIGVHIAWCSTPPPPIPILRRADRWRRRKLERIISAAGLLTQLFTVKMLQHRRIDNLIIWYQLLPRQAENIAVTRGFRQMMPPSRGICNSVAISRVRVMKLAHSWLFTTLCLWQPSNINSFRCITGTGPIKQLQAQGSIPRNQNRWLVLVPRSPTPTRILQRKYIHYAHLH